MNSHTNSTSRFCQHSNSGIILEVTSFSICNKHEKLFAPTFLSSASIFSYCKAYSIQHHSLGNKSAYVLFLREERSRKVEGREVKARARQQKLSLALVGGIFLLEGRQ